MGFDAIAPWAAVDPDGPHPLQHDEPEYLLPRIEIEAYV
jgi:hypothetical protein